MCVYREEYNKELFTVCRESAVCVNRPWILCSWP